MEQLKSTLKYKIYRELRCVVYVRVSKIKSVIQQNHPKKAKIMIAVTSLSIILGHNVSIG